MGGPWRDRNYTPSRPADPPPDTLQAFDYESRVVERTALLLIGFGLAVLLSPLWVRMLPLMP